LTSASLVDGEATSTMITGFGTRRGFVDRRRARHHDVRDPAFVAVHADRDAGTCVEGFTW
jgi:hypothetical protein